MASCGFAPNPFVATNVSRLSRNFLAWPGRFDSNEAIAHPRVCVRRGSSDTSPSADGVSEGDPTLIELPASEGVSSHGAIQRVDYDD